MLAKISVIIPTLNESVNIASTLSAIPIRHDIEVIIVDGGSTDNTVEITRQFSIKLIDSLPGRSEQMNRGATVATGEILLFLHGDTRLPSNFENMVRDAIQKPGVVAGAFTLQIDDNAPSLRWVEKGVKWRSRLFQLPYGDQAIFLTKETFEKIGGFPRIPIMEDFELIQRLKKIGKITIISASVITSPRRWLKKGIWQTTLINQIVIIAYYLGISPDRIRDWYRQGKFR
ncbi:TIGR04283 family arsenosugar biosynthesis glycosyltransferase [Calothrix sp. 336/3]|uniref:TIGR04283 family arsenosugar biosynthesis glycosyltransferase n=1 Tax=Calothrix sp. 336/3 TaxID=1337936 RepID=UPI0004E38EF7|nr:TIGR04283 family arsenosugar biosynthesis glycosyltransferase [Calothrix sp. 336/3]AKG24856.1 glycosyltransferase [Calothrix sp. 336/3]